MKNIQSFLLTFALLIFIVTISGCDEPNYPLEEVTLRVSEYYNPIHFPISLKYCGTIQDRFVVSPIYEISVTYFYPMESKTIFFNGYKIKIIEVTPEKLKFQVLGEADPLIVEQE